MKEVPRFYIKELRYITDVVEEPQEVKVYFIKQ